MVNAPIGKNEEQPDEKLLKQSEVNEIVGRARREGTEKGKKETLAAIQQQMAYQSPPPDQQVPPQMEDTAKTLGREEMQRMIIEESQKMAQQALAQQTVNEFVQKINAAKDKYSDLEQTIAQLNLPMVPDLVTIANSMDNTVDILYDLAKNPSKFANVLMLTTTAPHLAHQEIQKLSVSIKRNEEAKNQQHAPEPDNQIRPSITGTDNGSMSVSDLRKQSWLKA